MAARAFKRTARPHSALRTTPNEDLQACTAVFSLVHFVAMGGKGLALLQWALDNGCPADEGLIKCAVLSGSVAVVDFARSRGCKCARLRLCTVT